MASAIFLERLFWLHTPPPFPVLEMGEAGGGKLEGFAFPLPQITAFWLSGEAGGGHASILPPSPP